MTKDTIPLDALNWHECGHDDDPRTRLLVTIVIGDLPMHLEAIEVRENEWGMLYATYRQRDDDIGMLMEMEDTVFQTIEIEGRNYILYAVPHGT